MSLKFAGMHMRVSVQGPSEVESRQRNGLFVLVNGQAGAAKDETSEPIVG